MIKTLLSYGILMANVLLIGTLFSSCNESVDKSAAKSDAIEVVKSLNESPQSETTTTLAENEDFSQLEEETEREATQEDGQIIEADTKIADAEEDASEEDIPNTEEEVVENTTIETPSENEELETEEVADNSEPDTKEDSEAEPVPASKKSESNEKPKLEVTTSVLSSFTTTTNDFLSKHVSSSGLVAYSKIDKSKLNQITQQIAEADLSKANSTEKQAFYINAYNILVIKSLLDNNLPSSPLDVLGFFDAKKHKVAGEMLTLDQLEKGKLFGLKKDARFHFAVVCGAIGCPQLEPSAYTPSILNAQLNRQTKKALNNPNFTKVDDSAKKVQLSEIFKWYEADFTQDGKSLIDYINQYRDNPIPSDYTVEYYPYDWKINKQ